MNMYKPKNLWIPVVVAIIIMVIKVEFLGSNLDISTTIIYMYNSFVFENLIDMYSIAVYAVPIGVWTLIIVLSCNEFHENYTFLVTRLGGQGVYKRKLIVKGILETSYLLFSTYIVSVLILIIIGYRNFGNINQLLGSFLLNYTVVLILVMITIICRMYYSFSISITCTYFIEIGLLSVGLFLKYFQVDFGSYINPMMTSIIYFHGEPGKNRIFISREVILLNVILVAILIGYILLLSGKRRMSNA